MKKILYKTREFAYKIQNTCEEDQLANRLLANNYD